MNFSPLTLIMSLAVTVIMATAAFIGPALGGRARNVDDSIATIGRALDDARAAARVNDGATLEFAPAPYGSALKIYHGRPSGTMPYVLESAQNLRAGVNVGGVTSFALFIATDGSVTSSGYTHGQAMTSGTCSSSIVLSVVGKAAETLTVPCGEARVDQ